MFQFRNNSSDRITQYIFKYDVGLIFYINIDKKNKVSFGLYHNDLDGYMPIDDVDRYIEALQHIKGLMAEYSHLESKVPGATLNGDKYRCPECGARTFSSGVAVWCEHSDLEGGSCTYKLMAG